MKTIIALAGTLLIATSQLASAQNYGFSPASKPLLASDGNFYIENTTGGAYNNGTIVKVTPSGTTTLLYTFTNSNGSAPVGGLVQGSDGNFYGVTSGSQVIYYPFSIFFGAQGGETGLFNTQGIANDGTLFRLTPSGTLTTLVTFNGANGSQPNGLMVASNGVLYGTTYSGGASGDGTLFSLTTGGTFTTLSTFNGANGANPTGNLMQNPDGNLYGATTSNTLFKTPASTSTVSGSSTITSISFTAYLSYFPLGNLVHDASGNIYGVAEYDDTDMCIYEYFTTGQFCVVYASNEPELSGALSIDASGNLYLPFYYNNNYILKVVPTGSPTLSYSFSGTYTSLYSFGNGNTAAGGANPLAGLTQDSSGNFYGTTSIGGSTGGGTLFKLSSTGTYSVLAAFSPNPLISVQPTPQTVAVGQPVTFSVSAFTPIYPNVQNFPNATLNNVQTPSYSLSYQWERNGSPISGATGSTYTIPSPQTADVAYTYSVVVSSTAGSITSNAVGLTLTNPPVIGSQPTSQTETEFQTATFSIIAYGLQPLSYQWQRAPAGTTTYTNLSNGSLYSGAETSTLTVLPVSLAQSGDSFQCVVTNSAGTATTNTATLTVNAIQENVANGQPATFSVTPPGTGPFTYQWQYGGNNISGATSSSYTIPSVSSANYGTYTVVVTSTGENFTTTFGLDLSSIPGEPTPTMPQWMLGVLAVLLGIFAIRKKSAQATSNS
jgi:uncharacterized repeat protein (TIGR03803 family)